MTQRDGMGREEGSGWGTHVYLWRIHFDIWQNQYSIVKFKNKIKKKKAECWRIDAFELWCWRRLLRVPWTARRSKQSILKEISPEYSLEGLMLKLKLQYFGHLMWRTDSLEDPDAGQDWRQEEKGTTEDELVGWHHWFNGHESEQAPGVGDGQGILACSSPWARRELDTTEWLNWLFLTLIKWKSFLISGGR